MEIAMAMILMVLGAMVGGLAWHWYLVRHYNRAITAYEEIIEKQEEELDRYKYEVIVHDNDDTVTKHEFSDPYRAVLFMQTIYKTNLCTLVVFDKGVQVSVSC